MLVMRPAQDLINSHHRKILNFLNSDRKGEKLFCNKTLLCHDQLFAIHDDVLCATSDYFYDMLCGKENHGESIKLNEMSPSRLESVINYIYTGDIEVTEESVFDVLEDAVYTQITDLKSFCCQVILQMLSKHNCLKIREIARRYNLGEVERIANRTIIDNFAEVVESKDFFLLDASDMYDIINQRQEGAEENVLNAIVRWVNFNPVDRQELFKDLFSQLDLSAMSSTFLTNAMRNEHLIRSNADCCSWVTNAVSTKCGAHGLSLEESEAKHGFLVIGGNGMGNVCVKYDVKAKQREKFIGVSTNRTWSTALSFGNKVYVMGGANPTKSCEMINLEECKQWNKMADMLEPRSRAASAVHEDKIYVTGGRKTHEPSSLCMVYCVKENKWRKSFKLLQSREGHGAFAINNSIYCIGGYHGEKSIGSCERSDPRSKSPSQIAPLNRARNALACVELRGLIYAIGGYADTAYLETVEQYDPRMDKWVYVSPLHVHRSGHSACVLDNRIYIVGGSGWGRTKTVEVYDPIPNAWTRCFDLEDEIFGAPVVAI